MMNDLSCVISTSFFLSFYHSARRQTDGQKGNSNNVRIFRSRTVMKPYMHDAGQQGYISSTITGAL